MSEHWRKHDTGEVFLTRPIDSLHIMPPPLARFLADPLEDEPQGLRDLLWFEHKESMRNFASSYGNRVDRSKTGDPGQGPRVAITSKEVGLDIAKTAEKVAFYHRYLTKLGRVAAENRTAVEYLIKQSRAYASSIKAQTRLQYMPVTKATTDEIYKVSGLADRAVRQYFLTRYDSALVVIPTVIAQLAQIEAPPLVTCDPPEDFWSEIVKAENLNPNEGKGPLVEFDLDDLRKLVAYAHAIRKHLRAQPDPEAKPVWAAWNNLIYRVRKDYGAQLDEETAQV